MPHKIYCKSLDFFHLNDKEIFKRNNRKHLLSSKPEEHVHSVVVLHFIFFPQIIYKTNASMGGKENSLVSACLFCRESYKRKALLLICCSFLPEKCSGE